MLAARTRTDVWPQVGMAICLLTLRLTNMEVDAPLLEKESSLPRDHVMPSTSMLVSQSDTFTDLRMHRHLLSHL